jgi:hypothetical protein
MSNFDIWSINHKTVADSMPEIGLGGTLDVERWRAGANGKLAACAFRMRRSSASASSAHEPFAFRASTCSPCSLDQNRHV